MRETWESVPLGQIFETTNTRLGPYTNEPEVFSVTKYDGFVPADQYFGKRIASARLDTYKVVEPDEWAYSTIHIDEGSIARNRLGRPGVVSPMYTTMRLTSDRVHPYYAELLLRSPWMLGRYSDVQQGSINRRRSLPWKVFAGLTVPLPPLDEQRRIVDLIGALDDTIAAARKSERASAAVLAEIRRVPEAEDTRPLGTMVTMRSGPSWKAADEAKSPREGYERVLGITNTPSGGALDLTDQRFVSGVPASAQRLDEASLVMIRTNGNRARIGNVYRATPAVKGFAVSAFQIAIRPHVPEDASFLYYYLGSPSVQAAISENASGSTGLGNIAVGWLKQLEVPVLDAAALSAYVARCQAATNVHESAVKVLDRLEVTRSNLLTALLSGEHAIPESYDELMEESAA